MHCAWGENTLMQLGQRLHLVALVGGNSAEYREEAACPTAVQALMQISYMLWMGVLAYPSRRQIDHNVRPAQVLTTLQFN